MPVRMLMVVDERHDHAFRRPDPLQSAAVGAPDVCTGCHTRRSARWAANAIAGWRRAGVRPSPDFARALHSAAVWSESAPVALLALADDPAQPPIVRASALQSLAPWTSPATLPRLRAGLADPDPLVRAAAAAWSESFPPQIRAAETAPLLRDAVRSVRFAAVHALVAGGRESWPSPEPPGFRSALEEYRGSLAMDSDRVEGLVGLGLLAAWEGDALGAETRLRAAQARDPHSELAAANLADVLRARGDEAAAEAVLRATLERVPDSAALHHSLGLLLTRTERRTEALGELARAARLAPSEPRYAYVYGVALHDLEAPARGIAALEEALERAPGYPPHLEALAAWHAAQGEAAAAERYRERLQRLWGFANAGPVTSAR